MIGVIFDVTDSEGSCDLGVVTLIDERTATVTAGNPKLYEQHRCGLFRLEEAAKECASAGLIEFVVATYYSNQTLWKYEMGQWFDAKVISGFEALDEARLAFEKYGPSYLLGERLTWSIFKRL
jgi:hypothetical protein